MIHTHVVAAAIALTCANPAQDALAGLARDGDRILGVSPSYRAEFEDARVVFTPALGAAAATNMPLAIEVESVGRDGGAPLPARHRPARTVDFGHGLVVYTHDDFVAERYEVHAAGIEQSFVFPRPLPGGGDLVVRLRIDTDLVTDDGDHATLQFTSPAGGVHFGAITGIDAAGRKAAGMFRVAGDRVELRLPAAFVEHAAYPLVLDPLIGTSSVISGNDDALRPDGAFDESNDVYLAAFQVRYSSLDADVFAARLAEDGSNLGVLAVAASAELEIAPAVCSVNDSDRFLVAWQQAPSPFGIWNIHGRAVDTLGALSAVVPLAASPANDTDPDLAGEAVTGDDALLVYAEHGAGIKIVVVDVPAAGDPAALLTQQMPGSMSARAPAICQSGGVTGRAVVAWIEETTAGVGQIMAGVVNRAGFPISMVESIGPAESNRFDSHLDVDGDGTDFLLVFDRTQATGILRDASAQKLQYNGASLAQIGAPLTLANNPTADEAEPRVALLATKFLTVWLRSVSSSRRLTHAVFSIDCETCGTAGDVGVGGGGSRDSSPAIASQWAGGVTGDEAMILYGNFVLSLPFTGQVRAQRFDAMLGGALTTIHPGCGNGGTAGTNGPFAIGNTELEFTVTGADPATVLAGLSLSLASPPLTCGPCTFLTPAALIFTFPAAGSASVPFPLPCDAGFLGVAIEFQWLMFGAAGAPCPTTAGLATSEWRRIVIGQ